MCASYSAACGILTRDWTHSPCIARQILNHWTTREVPRNSSLRHSIIWMDLKCMIRMREQRETDQSPKVICYILYCCCCSVTKLCPTVCNPRDCSTPGFPILHYLLEFVQTHARWVSDAIQPSHPLSPPSPPALNLSQHRGFPVSQLSTSGGQSTGASASASVLPVNIQGWFPLGWLVQSPCSPRDSQEFPPVLQFKSINSLALSLLNGHEFEQTLRDSGRQGSLMCCSPWGWKELDST